jgi:hypothetical protein
MGINAGQDLVKSLRNNWERARSNSHIQEIEHVGGIGKDVDPPFDI